MFKIRCCLRRGAVPDLAMVIFFNRCFRPSQRKCEGEVSGQLEARKLRFTWYLQEMRAFISEASLPFESPSRLDGDESSSKSYYFGFYFLFYDLYPPEGVTGVTSAPEVFF